MIEIIRPFVKPDSWLVQKVSEVIVYSCHRYIIWFENHEELSHEETVFHGFLFFLTVAQAQEFGGRR